MLLARLDVAAQASPLPGRPDPDQVARLRLAVRTAVELDLAALGR